MFSPAGGGDVDVVGAGAVLGGPYPEIRRSLHDVGVDALDEADDQGIGLLLGEQRQKVGLGGIGAGW